MAEVIVVDSGEEQKTKRRLWLWIPLILFITIAILGGGFVFWALNPFVEIDDVAYSAMQSDDNVTVTDRAWLAFLPHTPPTTGFIFYPGGRVPAEAYAPIARQIAEEGYLAVIVYSPLNLAIFNTNSATPVMENFSAVENWVVGGHSLGGSAASIYAENNMDTVDGIVFVASYPVGDALVDSGLTVASIYGTNDGLATAENIDESRQNLPADTIFVEIDGGNHAQFGYYGEQGGDNPATIGHEEQIRQTVNAILDVLARVSR